MNYVRRVINTPSIIAATNKRGMTMKRKTFMDCMRRRLSSLAASFAKMNMPSFIPRPQEMKSAGSSKMP